MRAPSSRKRLYELYRQENQLINQYRSIIADPYVELDGQQLRPGGGAWPPQQMWGSITGSSTPTMPSITPGWGISISSWCRLRRQQAQLLGYDSYEQMQYELSFERDYSPEARRRSIWRTSRNT